MKILCMGQTCFDVTAPIESFPTENNKYRLETVNKCPGGSVSNVSYLLAKWGIPNTFAGVIGNDEYGNIIKNEMNKARIDTRFIETDYTRDTSITFILANKVNGARTTFNFSKERLMLTKYKFDFTPDIIVTDGNDFLATKNTLLAYQNAISIMNASRCDNETLEISKKVKWLVCSKTFAEGVSKLHFDYNDSSSLARIYQNMKSVFNNAEIIITLEDKGALYSIDNQIRLIPGLNVPVVDSTGAGDIFLGAFVYGINQGYNIEKSIKIANIAAGLSLDKYGARTSIPDFEKVKTYFESKEGTLLNDQKPQAPQINNEKPSDGNQSII